MYQADLGRFMVIDALSDSATSWTPFRYAYNNPLKYIDPDGNFEIRAKHKEKYSHFNKILQKIGEKSGEQRLVSVFSKHSGLSESKTKEYLTYGSGPLLDIGGTGGAWGTTGRDNNVITISKKDVKKLQKLGEKIEEGKTEGFSEALLGELQKEYDYLALELEKTVIHEGVHSGDFESNNRKPSGNKDPKKQTEGVQGFKSAERGEDFEEEDFEN